MALLKLLGQIILQVSNMLLSPTGEWSLSVILNLAFTNLNVSRTSNELDKLELRKKN